MAATDQPKRTLCSAMSLNKRYCHADAMQIFSFCMAVLSVAILNVFSGIYGAPEELKRGAGRQC
jgi:hypothetical protein